MVMPGHGRNDAIDIVTIREADPATDRINEELLGQAPGELFRPSQQVFPDTIRSIYSGAVRHFSCPVYGQALVVAISPCTDVIIMLHGKTERINLAVAFITSCIITVLFHEGTDSGDSAGVRFNRLDIRWGRIGRRSQQVFQNPYSAGNRLGFHTV